MENNPRESLIDTIAEILRVGLDVCDAMKRASRGLGSHTRVTADEQDWMVETTTNPRRIITITLVE